MNSVVKANETEKKCSEILINGIVAFVYVFCFASCVCVCVLYLFVLFCFQLTQNTMLVYCIVCTILYKFTPLKKGNLRKTTMKCIVTKTSNKR